MSRQKVTFKIGSRSISHDDSIPLINPVSFVTSSAWIEELRCLIAVGKDYGVVLKDSSKIKVSIKDLYFSKFYEKPRSFEKAERKLGQFGKAALSTVCLADEDEPRLELTLRQGEPALNLYQYKGSTCFALQGAVGSDGDGGFQNSGEPLTFTIEADRFLNLLIAIESVLIGIGETMLCRADIEVSFESLRLCSFEVDVYMEDAPLSFLPLRRKLVTALSPKEKKVVTRYAEQQRVNL